MLNNDKKGNLWLYTGKFIIVDGFDNFMKATEWNRLFFKGSISGSAIFNNYIYDLFFVSKPLKTFGVQIDHTETKSYCKHFWQNESQSK